MGWRRNAFSARYWWERGRMVNDVTGLRVAAVSSTHDAIDAVRAFPVATRPEARGPICNWRARDPRRPTHDLGTHHA